MGGIDCRYEYYNMNIHDLIIRIQHWGGNVHYAAKKVYTCGYNPNPWAGLHHAIQTAYVENDLPLFKQKYSTPSPNVMPIPLHNWMEQENIWHKRIPTYTQLGLCA